MVVSRTLIYGLYGESGRSEGLGQGSCREARKDVIGDDDLHEYQTGCLGKQPNMAKQGLQPPIPNTTVTELLRLQIN